MAYVPPAGAELTALMNYCKLDPTDELAQSEILACHAAAWAELMAGRTVPAEYAALSTLAVKSLTLHYYDHRDDTDPNAAPVPVGLANMMLTLRSVSNLGV